MTMTTLTPEQVRELERQLRAIVEYVYDDDGSGSVHVNAPFKPHSRITRAANALAALVRERDAGREWMRRAWHELNAIRARDGAPSGISEDYWSELVDALGDMLGADDVPWMTNAAVCLVKPYQQLAEAAEARAAALQGERDALRAEAVEVVMPFERILSRLERMDGNIEDYDKAIMVRDGYGEYEEVVTFADLRRARAFLALHARSPSRRAEPVQGPHVADDLPYGRKE